MSGGSGGRGTVRYMFAHPEMFCSAAPGGSGLGAERAQADNDGVETSSFEPPLASMSSQDGKTTLTLAEPTPRPGSDALGAETDREVRNQQIEQNARCAFGQLGMPLRVRSEMFVSNSVTIIQWDDMLAETCVYGTSVHSWLQRVRPGKELCGNIQRRRAKGAQDSVPLWHDLFQLRQ